MQKRGREIHKSSPFETTQNKILCISVILKGNMKIFCSPYKDNRLVHFTTDVESHLALKINLFSNQFLLSILPMNS